MSDFYDEQWYTDRWLSLSPEMRKRAADAIKKTLGDEYFALIRLKHAEYGHDWIHYFIDVPQEQRDAMNALLPEGSDIEECGWPATWSAHHGFGTGIRNLLRNEEYGAGIKDDELPAAPYEDGETHKNWDDYYVAAIEAAAGLRDV